MFFWDRSKPRQGQWDMRHIDGEEYRIKWQDYINNYDSAFSLE